MIEHLEILAIILMTIGLIFLILGSIGILKFGDVFLRLQASSKSLTFGFGFLILGVGVLTGDPSTMLKALIAVVFQFITAPIAAMLLARAALKRGIDPLEGKQPPPSPEPTAS